MATPFESELEANILATIRKAKRDGTVSMSVDCLKQNTPSPRTLDGAPQGTNAPYFYAEKFREVCNANPTIKRFVY